jgi:hypothetical protein
MAVRIEKVLATVLDEAYQRQIEETMNIPSEGPEEFYRTSYWPQVWGFTLEPGLIMSLL